MLFVLTFESTHLAMHAYKRLANSDIKCEVIPTPRQISSECGFSILGETNNIIALKDFNLLNKIKYDKIYTKKGDNYEES